MWPGTSGQRVLEKCFNRRWIADIYCKECGNVYAKNRKKTPGGGLKKIYSNPELARFSPRELIAELKARGYTGELKFTQTISL